MIETIKYATISQIFIKDLIFYEDQKKDECKKLCNDNGITFLPNKNRKDCYKLINTVFVSQPLSSDIICNPFDRLFDETTLAKFESGNHDEVMFVVENNKIKGVVHIVDYNADFINFEFFKAMYQFEKNLRILLNLKGKTNDSIIEWIKKEGENDKFWKTRYEQCMPTDLKKCNQEIKKRKDCNPF